MPAADGVPLHVEIDGPADAPVTVVLAHGWTLDRRTWGPVARALASGPAPVRVVRYDHRGHGRSAAVDPATMTIDQLADDLAEVLAATAPDGPLVLGGPLDGRDDADGPGRAAPRAGASGRPGSRWWPPRSGGLAEKPFGLAPRQAAVMRRVEQRVYGTRRWASRSSLGSPRLLAPGMRWLLLGPRAGAEARRITTETVAACRPLTVSGFRPTLEAHERDAALGGVRRRSRRWCSSATATASPP